MKLSDRTIIELIRSGEIVIKPFRRQNVQAASVDLRLGRGFLVPDYHKMDSLSLDAQIKYRKIKGDEITIPPHHFVLGTTLEYVGLPNYLTGSIEGRSSIGRRGLFVQNAGWVDPGFEGDITLELYNANESPIKILSGRRICQIVFDFTDNPVKNPYHGKYLRQKGTTGSLAHRDVEARRR